jgi:signal transduction histidine kinase
MGAEGVAEGASSPASESTPPARRSTKPETGSSGPIPPRHVAIAAVAAVAAAAAVWVTLRADFLAYPVWLAVQKADLILGPVLVGLYWLHVRPASRFGWLLIAFGFLCAGYITQSASNAYLFGTGLAWESLIYLGTLILILTFPTGRLDGIAAKVILAGGVGVAALNVWLIVMLPQTGAGGAISGCRELCPENGLAFAPNVELALDLIKPFQIAVIGVALATGSLLIWRIATGSPPQRRAQAIGTSVALLFTATQIAFLSLSLFEVDAPELQEVLQWTFTLARAAVWYGFLFALIAAQLFAGRALQRLVRRSMRRPSRRELEAMLREPLGDPSFQLRFWDSKASAWADEVEPGPGRAVTVVERNGTPAVALVHDAQLDDDPELLQAAGAVALLAAENAELDAAWKAALEDLQRSRERTSQAVDNERRRVAVDLHDGVQQRLGLIRLRLATSAELATDAGVRDRLDAIGEGIEAAIDEVREVSQALYPHLLIEHGLVAALEHAVSPLRVRHNEVGRHPAELDSAVYYACLEAVQNARKHGGRGVTIRVSVHEDTDELRFEVADDGPGFDPSAEHAGMGLQNLQDRLGAVGGRLVITSAPGRGTVVSGFVPLRVTEGAPERP